VTQPPPGGGEVDVVVSVADEHVGSLGRVADALRAAGMHVEQTLERIGVITGRVDAARLASLSLVDGVAAVEPSRPIDVGPPDSPVQ
jgi:hypothetical protein